MTRTNSLFRKIASRAGWSFLAIGISFAGAHSSLANDPVEDLTMEVVRADDFEARVIAGLHDDNNAVVNHTTYPISVFIGESTLSLASGGAGALSCEPEEKEGGIVQIEGRPETLLFVAAPCGSEIEIVEENTQWLR